MSVTHIQTHTDLLIVTISYKTEVTDPIANRSQAGTSKWSRQGEP